MMRRSFTATPMNVGRENTPISLAARARPKARARSVGAVAMREVVSVIPPIDRRDDPEHVRRVGASIVAIAPRRTSIGLLQRLAGYVSVPAGDGVVVALSPRARRLMCSNSAEVGTAVQQALGALDLAGRAAATAAARM